MDLSGDSPAPRSERSSGPCCKACERRVAALALRNSCLVLLRVAERPVHYATVARLIREQTRLKPSERQVLGALRVLESRGDVRRASRGVYECVARTSPSTRRPAA